MKTVAIRLKDGTLVPASCAAQFTEVLGTQRHTFAVTRRAHYARGWSLTHVESGWRVCVLPDLPMQSRVSKAQALIVGRQGLQAAIDRFSLGVVASKCQQLAMESQP